MCNTFKLPLVVHLLQSSATSVLNIRAVQDAFAFILGNGSVVTWDRYRGGNSSAVQAKLRDVQHIQASRSAFAANPVRWICRHLG